MWKLWPRLIGVGHEVRLLAPYDPDDRLARVTAPRRFAAAPAPARLRDPAGTHIRPADERGRDEPHGPARETIGVLGRELRSGNYDVVHVHEPNVPVVSWYAAAATRTGGGHLPHLLLARSRTSWRTELPRCARIYSKLSARIAVSRPRAGPPSATTAGATGSLPNGVDLSAARPDHLRPNEELKILFVGRAEERKGLPVLLRAFEALRGAGVEARLTVAGPAVEEVEPLLLEPEGVEIAGPVDEAMACWARPTCSARPRSAARASAWSSRRRSPRARRWWRRTSPATARWRATAGQRARAGRGRGGARREALRSLAFDQTGAPRWPRPRASAPSASPGRT